MKNSALPRLWLDLLSEAAADPDGLLSLTDPTRSEDTLGAAERMTDLGLFRIVTARRYRLSEAGRTALATAGARNGKTLTSPVPGRSRGLWSRMFGKG